MNIPPLKSIPPTRLVDLMLTYNCNSACPYCFVRESGRAIAMTPQIIDRSVDWICETAGEQAEILFLGGEPTLEPLLIERTVFRFQYRKCRPDLRVLFNMTTNGMAITPELAEKLARWGIPYMISIDGAAERHNRSRPARNGLDSFEIIREKIPLIKKYLPRLSARMTVIPENASWVAEDMAVLQEMGINHIIISPASGLSWSDEQLETYVAQLVSFASRRKMQSGRPYPPITPIDEPRAGRFTWGCGAGRGRVAIDPLGHIFACSRFAQTDTQKGLALGDIYNGIDPCGAIRKFQDDSHYNRRACAACEFSSDCLGGCPAINYDDTGSIITPSPQECRMAKVNHAIHSRPPGRGEPEKDFCN